MRAGLLVAAAAVALYAPTAGYGFVQDDRAVVEHNQAAHSLTAAIGAAAEPYWPAPPQLWRPLTIVSFAVDWSLGGGRPGVLHIANAVWHGVVTLLLFLLLARWLPVRGAVAAALVFAAHPVHVEAVAGLVGRSELLVAAATLGGVLAARRRHWVLAVSLAAAAMLSKEHGPVAAVAIVLYCWLDTDATPPPRWSVAALGLVTVLYLAAWLAITGGGAHDVAAPFLGRSATERLPLALAAVGRAAGLLVWPRQLSVDYGPQVMPVSPGIAQVAGGVLAIVAVVATAWLCRRRAPVVTWALAIAALAYLPTSNLLFPSGVVLAERNLYLAVLAPVVLVGVAVHRARRAWGSPAATLLAAVVVGVLAAGSLARLPAWRDNRALLLTLLVEHPESAAGQASAAAVLAGTGDVAGASTAYDRSIALYGRDPHVLGRAAWFALDQGDTALAGARARRARTIEPRQVQAVSVEIALARVRGDSAGARALEDSAAGWGGSRSGTYPSR